MRLKNAIKTHFCEFRRHIQGADLQAYRHGGSGGGGRFRFAAELQSADRGQQSRQALRRVRRYRQGDIPAEHGYVRRAAGVCGQSYGVHNVYRENVCRSSALRAVISLFYFVGMFFTNIANFSLGKMVNDYMSSLTKTGFTVGVFNSLGRASLYSLIELAVSLVFYVAVTACAFLLYGSYLPPYSRSSSPCWSW